jgi:2-polyprenyl-3-methyl-5-hydroxy-6-metoxy-1,4-benzoquinol methylase
VKRIDELSDMLECQGFEVTKHWLKRAKRGGLKRVEAERLDRCPDCEALSFRKIGQYIYYSNLMSLRECLGCGLIFSDTRLPSELTSAHFESTYKDENYFTIARRTIFDEIAELIDSHSPIGAEVIDVGAATGLLMAKLKHRRPDLFITVSDISSRACEIMREKYGFHALHGGLQALCADQKKYDIVTLCDVIYYEPDINGLWNTINDITVPGSTIFIRIPNKLPLIRFSQAILRYIAPWRARWATTIPFFNPEHIFVFSNRYLINRLHRQGFDSIYALPSSVLHTGGLTGLLGAAWNAFNKLIFLVSRQKLIASPSILIIAKRADTPAL